MHLPSPIQALHADLLRLEVDVAGKRIRGIEAAARAIGRSPGVLYNKLSEADDRYHVSDVEADALADVVLQATGSRAYVEAKCARHGGVFVPLPDAGVAGDDDVLAGVLETMRQAGSLAQELTEARADALITPDEFAVLRGRAARLICAVQRLLADVATQVREPAAADDGLARVRAVRA